MKILLNANIDNLGKLGDIVTVKPGYARNYLLPKGLAVLPNKHNLEVMEYKKVKAAKQLEIEKLSAMEQKTKLEALTLIIKKKAGEQDQLFGSVTPMEIEKQLEEQFNVTIERKKYHLEDDHIKKLGDYICQIRLVEDIVADLKIKVIPEEERPAKEETETAVEEAVEEETEEVVEEVAEEAVEEVAEEAAPKTDAAEEE